MIKPEERFWAGSGNLLFGGPQTWHITDLDQRRHFSVTYAPIISNEDEEETEKICLEKLRKHVHYLDEDVTGIRFSDPDGPITISTDLEDDVSWYVNCYPLKALELLFPVKTTHLENLKELDRLGPQVELVSYPETPRVDATSAERKAELSCWSRLPRDYPHIVPFDSVVLDNVGGRVVGFTSLHIPSGTPKDNDATTRPFRLQWFRQLLDVVDDLNYRYGIMHQDIAAWNLIIDENDNLCIFGFNYCIMIKRDYMPEWDDIKGVVFTLYEIITLDEHSRHVPAKEQDAEALLKLEWTKHPDVKLDSEVPLFRDLLTPRVEKRRGKEFEPLETWVQWPLMPEPPIARMPKYDSDGKVVGTEMKFVLALIRREMVDIGEPYWKWERPTSYQLGKASVMGEEGQEKRCTADEDVRTSSLGSTSEHI